MSKKAFIPLEGLNRLTPAELEEYYLAACTFLQIPPELGLLYYRFVDTGDAGAERMLLIKRGACEIIRQRLEISVTSLTRQSGVDGMISYQATGKSPSGRQEIAVGNQTTHNQFAKDLANADMAASTKALIRLTLQFAGVGLLWEGEIDTKIATNTDAAKPVPAQEKIAATPVPTIAPTVAPGKDITPDVAAAIAGPPVQFSNPIISVKAENASPQDTAMMAAICKDVITVKAVSVPSQDTPIPQDTTPKKRTLRKKKEEPIAEPQPQVGDQVQLADGSMVKVAAIGTAATSVSSIADISESQLTATSPPPAAPLTGGDVSAEELRAFRLRNSEYSGIHFKKGNMQPLEGIGGNYQQLEAYWRKCIPDFVKGMQLSRNQWNTVLDKLDGIRENQGVEGLVKHVQEAITGG